MTQSSVLVTQSSLFSAGVVFALFILPSLIIVAAVVLAIVLKEKGE